MCVVGLRESEVAHFLNYMNRMVSEVDHSSLARRMLAFLLDLWLNYSIIFYNLPLGAMVRFYLSRSGLSGLKMRGWLPIFLSVRFLMLM